MKAVPTSVALRRYSEMKSRVAYCKLVAGRNEEITLLMTDEEGRQMRDQLCDLYGTPYQP